MFYCPICGYKVNRSYVRYKQLKHQHLDPIGFFCRSCERFFKSHDLGDPTEHLTALSRSNEKRKKPTL